MELRLREERIDRDWSQEYVGKIVGLTAEAIHYIETGQRNPSYKVLIKLENLFGLEHHELFAPVRDPQSLNKHCNTG